MTTKTKCKPVYTKLMNRIHPDKVDHIFHDESVVLSARANKLYTELDLVGLTEMLRCFDNGEYFKVSDTDGVKTDEPLSLHLNELKTLKTNGKTRTMGKGYLLMQGIEGKVATNLLDQVWSRTSGASKTDIVKTIINLQKQGFSNKIIGDKLCATFNFAPSTGKTIVSHLSYMVEYANQVNK